MKHVFEQTITITLILEQKEARWLNGAMQNPLHNRPETLEEKEIRTALFLATKLPKEAMFELQIPPTF